MSLGRSSDDNSMFVRGAEVREQRVPKKKYQYADTQLDEVGRDWEGKGGDRVYKSPDGHNKTGLEEEDVAAIEFSKEFMLPYNESGVHWAAFAVNLVKIDGIPQVNIRFTDSLGKTQKFDELPDKVKAEANRIASLFGESAVVTQDVYKDTWMQNDVVSCGPYCLANAERALAGKGAEPDPGEEAVRVEQLAVMRNPAAIKACSSNSLVDTMLTEWMLSRGKGKPMLPEGDFVSKVCEHFNSTNPQPGGVDDLKAIFTAEYGASQTQSKTRLNELAIDMGYGKSTPELIEESRRVLESKVGAEASYQKMSDFMQALSGRGGFLGELESSSRALLEDLREEDKVALRPVLQQIDSNIRFTEGERNLFNGLKAKYGEVATHLAIGSDLPTALSEAGLHEAPSDMSRASSPASITSRVSAGAGQLDSVGRRSPSSPMSTSSDLRSRRSSASSAASAVSLDQIRDDLESGGAEKVITNVLDNKYADQEMFNGMCTSAMAEGEDLTKERIEGFLEALSEAQRVSMSRSPSPTERTVSSSERPVSPQRKGRFSRLFGR